MSIRLCSLSLLSNIIQTSKFIQANSLGLNEFQNHSNLFLDFGCLVDPLVQLSAAALQMFGSFLIRFQPDSARLMAS